MLIHNISGVENKKFIYLFSLFTLIILTYTTQFTLDKKSELSIPLQTLPTQNVKFEYTTVTNLLYEQQNVTKFSANCHR